MSNEIKWITVKGTHIPILPGQTKEEAIKSFISALEQSDEAKKTSTKRLQEKLAKSLTEPPKYEIVTPHPQKTPKQPTISSDHYSRLKRMWSDYHLGTCKPVEKDGVKYFNVDKTIYFVNGNYPYFTVFKKKTFRNHFLVSEYLKEIANGR